jgi:hypothetical protein
MAHEARVAGRRFDGARMRAVVLPAYEEILVLAGETGLAG